jgi:glutathione S-transferase
LVVPTYVNGTHTNETGNPGNYEQIPALAERGKLRIERFLTEVDDLIGDKPFVAGDAFTVADINLLVLIDFAKWRKLSLPDNATRARSTVAKASYPTRPRPGKTSGALLSLVP